MVTFITVVYVMVCVFLILVVLLQAGRGGGMGAAMGGSSQTVFGGAGAGNFLQRLTVVSASLFMVLSAVLAYMSSAGDKSLDAAAERIRRREEAAGASTVGAQPTTPDNASEAATSEGDAPVSTEPAEEEAQEQAPAASSETEAAAEGAAPSTDETVVAPEEASAAEQPGAE